MPSGAERTERYESRKRAAGYRKVHLLVPEERADELKAVAARMRDEHEARRALAGLKRKLDRLKPELRERGVVNIAIFGSAARGDARAAGDIDLVADLDPGRKPTLLDLVAIEQYLEEKLGQPVDLIDRASLKPEFAAEIAADEIPVF